MSEAGKMLPAGPVERGARRRRRMARVRGCGLRPRAQADFARSAVLEEANAAYLDSVVARLRA